MFADNYGPTDYVPYIYNIEQQPAEARLITRFLIPSGKRRPKGEIGQKASGKSRRISEVVRAETSSCKLPARKGIDRKRCSRKCVCSLGQNLGKSSKQIVHFGLLGVLTLFESHP